jgi:hypothetical protein
MAAKRMSLDDFILKSNIIHNNKFNYSNVNYINSHTNIQIICPKHGVFLQRPNSHLNGFGCNRCNIENKYLTIDEFINKAKQIHGTFYDYSSVVYTNSHNQVSICCPIHGTFEQTPNMHLSGKQGCPKCHIPGGKYNDYLFATNPDMHQIKALVYLVQINLNNITYNKIGMTKRSISQRYAGFSYVTIIEHQTTLYNAWKIEQQLLEQFKQYRLTTSLQFCGWTEIILQDIDIIQTEFNKIVKGDNNEYNRKRSKTTNYG